MKKPFPFYPPLVAAYPVLALYSANAGFIRIKDLFAPVALCAVGGAATFGLLTLLFRNARVAALCSLLAVVFFFSFAAMWDFFYRIPAAAILVPEALVITALGLFLRKRRFSLETATRVLNFAGLLLMILPIASIFLQRPSAEPSVLSPSVKLAQPPVRVDQPDIYFIILDGYGRADQLKRVMGFDNAPFVRELEKRGFYVPRKASPNYCQTELSLASILNISYLQAFPDKFVPGDIHRDELDLAIDRSFVSRYLRDRGYSYVGVVSGFPNVDFRSADARFSQPMQFTMLESTLVQWTPLASGFGTLESMYTTRRRVLDAEFDYLAQLAGRSARPKFVAAHILAPHPPFVAGPNGEMRRQPGPFGYYDGSHFMSMGNTRDDYIKGYTGQLQYINKRVLASIDAVLGAPGKRPIIILLGDHGSKLNLDQELIEKTDLREVFGNLQAYLLPEEAQASLSEDFTPVNAFRVLLRSVFKEPLDLLPNRSYYSSFADPYRFQDVSGRIR